MSISAAAAKQPNYYKSSFIFLFLSLLSSAVNYAYYPVIARFLPPAEFGAVQALIAILLQVGAVFAGLNLVTIYLVNKLSADEAKKSIEILQKFTTGLFLVATLLVTVFQAAVLNFLNIDNRLYIFILALDLVTTIPFIVAFGYLQARRQFVTAGLLQLSVVLTKLIAGALLVNSYGASGALAGIAVGQVLGMVAFWAAGSFYRVRLWDHRALGSLMPPSISELKFLGPMAKNALAIFIVNVALVIYISFGILAARHYFPPHDSGLFTGAWVLSSAIVFVCLPLIGVLLPHLDTKSLASSQREFLRTTTMVLVVVIASSVFLAVLASPLLKIFGAEYVSMDYLMLPLAIVMSLIALITLTLQVSAFYAPFRASVICLLGLIGLVFAVMFRHGELSTLVSTINSVFVTILVVGILLIIWTYNRGSRKVS